MFETLRVIRFSFRDGGFFEFRWMDNMVSYFRQSEHRSTESNWKGTRGRQSTSTETNLSEQILKRREVRYFWYNGRIKEGIRRVGNNYNSDFQNYIILLHRIRVFPITIAVFCRSSILVVHSFLMQALLQACLAHTHRHHPSRVVPLIILIGKDRSRGRTIGNPSKTKNPLRYEVTKQQLKRILGIKQTLVFLHRCSRPPLITLPYTL